METIMAITIASREDLTKIDKVAMREGNKILLEIIIIGFMATVSKP